PPRSGAADEQQERREPQHVRRRLDGRLVQDEIAVTRNEVRADLVVAFAAGSKLAHFATEVFGKRRVAVGEWLVLADETAPLVFERLQSRVERLVRCSGCCDEQREERREGDVHDRCSSRTSGKIV